jgi:N-dimethylarginine dimethylaminohydrolase
MCRPTYFDVAYEINAWMHIERRPDHALALAEWTQLYRTLEAIDGVSIDLVEPRPGLPDMVFTANAGIVSGDAFVPSRFRFAQRQGESPHFNAWFDAAGYRLIDLPESAPGSFEGEGDALYCGDMILAGYRQRTEAIVYSALAAIVRREVLPLELADPRWYHLDTCLTPLGDRLIAYYPGAFDEYAIRVIESLPGERIELTEHDALRFAANAVVIGHDIVLNSGCSDFESALASRGYRPHPVDLSEFLKAGGAAKCLALVLDHL